MSFPVALHPSTPIHDAFTSDYNNSPAGFHDVPFSLQSLRSSNQPYTKYLCIYLLGYPRRFCLFDGDDTTGSFLGPRGVFFFLFTLPSRNVNRPGEYHGLYPCRPVTWVSPPPLQPSTILPLFLRCVGEDSFLLLQVGGRSCFIVTITPHVTVLRGIFVVTLLISYSSSERPENNTTCVDTLQMRNR